MRARFTAVVLLAGIIVGLLVITMMIMGRAPSTPADPSAPVAEQPQKPAEQPTKPPIYGLEPEKEFRFKEPPSIGGISGTPSPSQPQAQPRQEDWQKWPLVGALLEGLRTIVSLIEWILRNVWVIVIAIVLLVMFTRLTVRDVVMFIPSLIASLVGRRTIVDEYRRRNPRQERTPNNPQGGRPPRPQQRRGVVGGIIAGIGRRIRG